MTTPAPDLSDDYEPEFEFDPDDLFEEHDLEPDPTWIEAEAFILERMGGLTRWDAERWTAAHEREVPPVSMRALRASLMQAAINARKSDYLEATFERIEQAVIATSWAGPVRADTNTDIGLAVEEAASGVTAIAQHAMAAVVLADELEAGGLSDQRREQLAMAKEKVYADLVSSC